MQVNPKILTLILTTVCLAFSSCEKEDDLRKNSNLKLITGTPWNLQSVHVNPGVDTDGDCNLETELHAGRGEQCVLDNMELFYADYKHTLDEGASKCNATYPQFIYSGFWAFYQNETKLIKPWGLNKPADTLDIVSLLKTEMILKDQEILNNVVYTYTYRYIR